MNKEQKRKYIKKLKDKGFSQKDIDLYVRYKELSETSIDLPEGIKVRLDVGNIKSHPDYPRFTEKYRNWVDSNKDSLFTVEYIKDGRSNHNVVTLKEDDFKWRFWTGDFKVVE